MSRLLDGNNRITKTFNEHLSGWAHGADIVKDYSELSNIKAHTKGTVTHVVNYIHAQSLTDCPEITDADGTTYGNHVIIMHENGYATLYAHLQNVNVSEGQTVEEGTIIGYMGGTGKQTGAHLHFEVRRYSSLSPSNWHDKSLFEMLDCTEYIEGNLPEQTIINSNDTVNECRYKIKVSDVQIGAYSGLEGALSEAKSKNGIVYDAVTNLQVYPIVNSVSVFNAHLRDLQKAINDDGITDRNGNRLNEDGLWGSCTESALEKISLMKWTDLHNVTAWVQFRIGTTPDGYFGNGTENKVNAYKSCKGWDADGIAGIGTIKAILVDYGVNI